MKTVENLVFGGGGMLGAAYVGAYQILQEYRLAGNDQVEEGGNPTDPATVFGGVKRTAGTSAGAIFAALVALGNSADAVTKLMRTTDLATFADIGGSGHGLCKGAAFLNWMSERTEAALKKKNATFRDLAEASVKNGAGRYKDLHVFAHSIADKRTVEFSAETTPEVIIAEAVRASMSVPFFFDPATFSQPEAMKKAGAFIDGGVAFNYPISAFDTMRASDKTIGFFLEDMSYRKEDILHLVVHIIQYALLKKADLLQDELGHTIQLITESVLDFIADYREQKNGGADDLFALVSDDAIRVRSLTGGDSGAHLADMIRELDGMIASAKAGRGTPINALWYIAVVNLVAVLAYQMMTDENFIENVIQALKDVLVEIGEFMKAFFAWVEETMSIVGATINLPTNLVYQRDSGRTIFLNCLGYQFADFWLPMCCTDRLIASGRVCSRASITHMMYS